ncbi:MAG: fused MFS/spermidine synthase, partial [Vicinamibacteria bacterium]
MSRTERLWPLALSLFLSGAAALVYQVIWVRELTLLLGTTLEAISIVLGLFMGGLGLGGALAARWIDEKPTSSLPRAYALLELGIALFAILFPFLVAALTPLSAWGTALLLLVPTTLMGATLPTLVALRERARAEEDDAGSSAGILYAANTAGAVVGSLGAALVLLPFAGMRLTTFLAAASNALAALVVLWSARRGREGRSRETPVVSSSPLPQLALTIAALSGFAGLTSEVAWTRSLVLLIGPTAYGYSFIVSAVIFGLAIGGAAGARFPRRGDLRALGWAQLGAATASLALLQILGRLAIPVGNLVHEHGADMATLLGIELFAVTALLLPSSFFLGATFPLAVSAVARENVAPGRATGATFAWNTIGALTGSLAAGFLLIPRLGTEIALYAAAGIHLLASAGGFSPRRFALPLGALVALAAPFILPRWDRELLSGGLYKYATYLEPGEFLDFLRQGDLLFHREDEVATVSVRKVASRISLAIDGKVDATNSEDMLTQRMLAHLPLLLHRDPKDVLVIGLGSGVTAGSALTHPIESLEAVEISKGVVEASAFFEDVNRKPSSDP